MKRAVDYSIYLVTDQDLMSSKTVEEGVRQALEGGCTLVQLREKHASSRDFYESALRVKAVTDVFQVPLIINDRLDVALAVDAAGVHVGQSDLPAAQVRRILGPDKILGVSAATLQEAQRAQADGADYLGIGAMFSTATKTDTRPVSMEELAAIRQGVDLPLVVIGGINQHTIPLFAGTEIDGLAIVSAIFAAPDIRRAAQEVKELYDHLPGVRHGTL